MVAALPEAKPMTANQELIQAIAREVLARIEERLGPPAPSSAAASGDDGVFETVDQAVKAAAAAQPRVASMGLADRERMNAIIRRICHDNADELARIELAETRIGRADHKAVKLRNIRFVLGTEAMRSDAASDAPDRVRAVGRDRHGVAGHAFRAHHGEQCDQYPGRRQHRCVQPAPGGR
jgi:acyl-CoA reductase-like NAD-dependent aldehyde dehydrogenase